ncbi:MAG: AI-2E family transporter [Acidobacteriaceae bacterium]
MNIESLTLPQKTLPEERTGPTHKAEVVPTSRERFRSHRGEILFAFALAIGLLVAYRLRDVLIILFVSALFAVVLLPVMQAFMRIKIRRWQPGRAIAVLLMLAIMGGAIALFSIFALPPVVHDLREVVVELPTRGPATLARLKRVPFASHIDFTALNAKLQDYGSHVVGYILSSFAGWAGELFKIITGLVLTVYFLLEGDIAYKWFLSFFPAAHRGRLNDTLQRAAVRMGKWLLGQGLLMLILGVLSTIVFVLLHVRFAYVLGVLMGAFNLIPVVGAMVSMALVIVAAATTSWSQVLWVCVFYAIYVQLENSYLTPRIMQRQVGLAGITVIVALLLGGELAGVVGAMVSVPTAVLVAMLLDEYAVQHDELPSGTDHYTAAS